VQGIHRGFDDVPRCVKVGLADLKMNNLLALKL
jgi:hypothetical protein